MRLDADPLYVSALEADRHLLGPEQSAWLERLDRDRESLYSLLEQLINSGNSERALWLAGALARYWWMRGETAAGRKRMEQVLHLPGGSEAARVAALVGAGSLAYAAGDFLGARHYYEQAFPFLRATGRQLDLARALDQAGMAARQLMELAAADTFHAQALNIQRRLGTPAEQALCLNNRGVVAFFRGQLDVAQKYHQEALALREEAGDIRGKASSLNNLGQVARLGGDLAAARSLLEEGLALRRRLGDRWGLAGSQVNLAAVYASLSDSAVARSHLRAALMGFQEVGDPLGVCECLEAEAELAHVEGRWADAVRSFSFAALRRKQLPAPMSPLLDRTVARLLAELRDTLGDQAYQMAWREGHEPAEALLEQVNGNGP